MKIVRATGATFVTVGALLLLFVLYELVGTTAITRGHQSSLRQEFVRALREPAEPRSGPPVPRSPSPSPAPPSATGRPGAVARLVVPRLDIDVMVVKGVTRERLAWGPGVYPESAALGAQGSVSIAGHRTGWGSPFLNLDRLRRGDVITLETPDGTYSYRVTRAAVVEPDDVWVLGGDPRSTAKFKLTLTTCTPKFTARDRLIVWADLFRTETRATEAAG